MAEESEYIHGTDQDEQRRLTVLNELLNSASLGRMRLRGTERVLDVASGLGQLTRAMARAVDGTGCVVGVEADAAQLAEARRQAAEENESELVDFRQGDAFALPLQDSEWETFDLVHTRFLLEHVREPNRVVDGMFRAVRPGGRIVLEDDDHEVLKLWPPVPEFERVWQAYIESYRSLGNDPFVGRRLVSLLHDAGATSLETDILFFGSCAGARSHDAMVANFVGIAETALPQILRRDLMSPADFHVGLEALRQWGTRGDAALWYGRCWAQGVRPSEGDEGVKASPTRTERQKPDPPENERQASYVRFLADSARDLNSTLDLQEVFRKIAGRVHELVDYHLFCLGLWNEQTQLLEHAYSLCYGEPIDQQGGFPLGYGISGSAAQQGSPIRVSDVREDARYVRYRHSHVDIRSELAIPLMVRDRLIGTIDLESTEHGAFNEEHEEVLCALASHVAVALENARLFEQAQADRKRLEADLETARQIQRRLLPDRVPEVEGYEFGTGFVPARELSGDFFDFLPYGGSRLALVAGDVAGKATPAALFGSLTVGSLRAHALEHAYQPAEMFDHLTQELAVHTDGGRFVTAVFAVIDADRRQLVFANAGFPYPVLVRNGQPQVLTAPGLPLGITLRDSAYEQHTVALEAGDLVVFCSDGIEEAQNADRELFGKQRVVDLLCELTEAGAQTIANRLMEVTDEFEDGSARDDRTVLVLKVL